MNQFIDKAKETMDEIFNLIESKYDNFEVDFEDENLRIDSVANNNVFIVSIHSPTSQIWLSSPISGAHHFKMSSSSPITWESTRDREINLLDLLISELEK